MKRNYDDPSYKRWRQAVYARDNHVCQWPNCKEKKKLNAHHINMWAHHPGLRYDVNNGITLCKAHHKMITGLETIYASIFLKIIMDKKNERS